MFKEYKLDDEMYYFSKTSVFKVFELEHLDSENFNEQGLNKNLTRLFSEPSLSFDFISDCKPIKSNPVIGTRGNYTEFVPVNTHRLFLVIKKELSIKNIFRINPKKCIKSFDKLIDLDLLKSEFKAKLVTTDELPSQIQSYCLLSFHNPVINTGDENMTIFKLKDLSTKPIFTEIWSILKGSLGSNFTVVTTVKPLSKHSSETHLRRLSRKRDAERDLTGAKKKLDTEQVLSDVTLGGNNLCEIDCVVYFKSNLDTARHTFRSSKLVRDLSYLAEFTLETWGAKSVLMNSTLSSLKNLYIKELSNKISPYIPLITQGDATARELDNKSLFLQRRDNSLSRFDYFNIENKSHNYLIIGQTGTGKSVLTGLILDNLSKNQNCTVQVLDVGSSHVNTINQLGGVISSFTLSEPSGLNPFYIVNNGSNVSVEEITSILSDFICNLILEIDEKVLNRELQSIIETEVKKFVLDNRSSTVELTINDFLNLSEKFPRKKLLERYGSKGLYKNAFMPKEGEISTNLQYFDFKEIFQAQDPSFSKAAMSALITCFNYLVLTDKERKKVLIIDECPVFIKENYNFLCNIASNIRKYGGSICIIAQTTDQVCLHKDTRLISQLKNKLLYTVDGKRDEYIERLNIDSEVYEKIKSLRSEQKISNEVLYTNGEISKIYRVSLTPEEYYKLSSDDDDKKKIRSFQNSELNLSKQEAIDLLEWLERKKGIRERRSV